MLVLILGLTAWFLYKQNIKEAGTAAVANSVNQGNTAVQEKKDEGDKITAANNEDNSNKQEENKSATSAVISTAAQKKKEAEQVYQASPKTPEAAVARDTALDRADIDSLWDAFCQGQPNNSQCAKGVAK